MISMAKSFDENIAAGNESYEKFCLQLINHGKIEDKFAALLNTDDVVSIVMLSIIRCWDAKALTDQRTGKRLVPKKSFTNETGGQSMKQCVKNIAKLYTTLPQDTKEGIVKSIGLDCSMDLNLDDENEFNEVVREMSRKFHLTGVKPVGVSGVVQ